MAVRLHRCPLMFLKVDGHGCWAAQQALEEAGVEHEIVKVSLRKSKRDEVERLTGQRVVPVLELEDGTGVRAEGKELARRIREGELPTSGGSAPAGRSS
jgi:glutaredoxin